MGSAEKRVASLLPVFREAPRSAGTKEVPSHHVRWSPWDERWDLELTT